MKSSTSIINAIGLALGIMFSANVARGDSLTCKVSQSGFWFDPHVHPRTAAMAGAAITLESSVEALYQNPAGLALIDGQLGISYAYFPWFGDVTLHQGGIVFQPTGKQYRVAAAVHRENYGAVIGTLVAQNDSGFVETGCIEPFSQAINLGYAWAISQQLSIGLGLKYLTEHLGIDNSNNLNKTAYDWGFIYRPGFHSLAIAMAWQNYAFPDKDETLEMQGYTGKCSPPAEISVDTRRRVGVSLDMANFFKFAKDIHSLIVAGELIERPLIQTYKALGFEYSYNKTFFIRTGYLWPKEPDIKHNFGLGLRLPFKGLSLQLDYAYYNQRYFGRFNRFAIHVQH